MKNCGTENKKKHMEHQVCMPRLIKTLIKSLSGDTTCSSNVDKIKLSIETDFIILPFKR